MRRIIHLAGGLTLGAAVALAACSAQTTTAVTATISKAQNDLQLGINLYGVAKGIAEVAVLADPALGPLLNAGIAAADPVVAKAQIALDAATVDATAIEALTAQITQQANMLTITAAPKVTVIPNKS